MAITTESNMLVLSRKAQESVVLSDTDGSAAVLIITVLDIRPGKVRLGFDAKPGVTIHRLEVWKRLVAAGLPVRRAGPVVG